MIVQNPPPVGERVGYLKILYIHINSNCHFDMGLYRGTRVPEEAQVQVACETC